MKKLLTILLFSPVVSLGQQSHQLFGKPITFSTTPSKEVSLRYFDSIQNKIRDSVLKSWKSTYTITYDTTNILIDGEREFSYWEPEKILWQAIAGVKKGNVTWMVPRIIEAPTYAKAKRIFDKEIKSVKVLRGGIVLKQGYDISRFNETCILK